MALECPHCGKSIMVIKSEDVSVVKAVGRDSSDLAGGIVKATVEAITEKVSKVVDSQMSAIGSLEKFNMLASGNLGSGRDGSLSAGWGGAVVQSLKKREELAKSEGYDPKEFVKQAKSDPENVSKEKAAKMLQSVIHGALMKGNQ